MAEQNESVKLTSADASAGVLSAPGPNKAAACMYCGADDLKGHWECIHTGDEESLDGYEDWFCCHVCRDARLPCETFHKIPIPPVPT